MKLNLKRVPQIPTIVVLLQMLKKKQRREQLEMIGGTSEDDFADAVVHVKERNYSMATIHYWADLDLW